MCPGFYSRAVKVNIKLQTQTDNPSLELRNVAKFPNSSDFQSFLVVKSSGFMVERPFYFENSQLQVFIEDLSKIDVTLKGKAVLKPQFEDDFICLEGDGKGHVIVTGEVYEHSETSQVLKFCFITDQTFIKPFLSALKSLYSD
jgi:hypothetical protein